MNSKAMHGYLQKLARRIRLDRGQRDEILRELQGHLEDRVAELQKLGVSFEEAWRTVVKQLGEPDLLGKEIYAAHSRASWTHTLVGALPHFLFALLFALHLWTVSVLVAVFLISATVTSVLAWRRGPPQWVYPWLGYCLVAPVAAGLFASSELGQGIVSVVTLGRLPLPFAVYLAAALYVPLALWALWRLWIRVLLRDWLFATLTVFPFPFLASWLLYLNQNGGPFAYESERLQAVDGSTALVFLGLALTTAVVYRVGQRLLKVGVMTLAIPLLIVIAGLAHQGAVLSGTVFLLLVFGIVILVLPAYQEARLASDRRRGAG
ncbi:MAG: hypothetical protein HYY31_06890 [Chloroflexi bacterium]|nr:hypothetical protein [Chloroflexota bacterium]